MKFLAIAAIGCAAYGVWYAAIGGKQVGDEQVRAMYREYWSAFDRNDAKSACAFYAADVEGQFTSTSRAHPVKEKLDKATACAAVDAFYATKRQLEEQSGTELYTNLSYRIDAIEIAPDRRSARVELFIEQRIGTEQKVFLDQRTRRVDTVTRDFGKAHIAQSDGTVSFYR